MSGPVLNHDRVRGGGSIAHALFLSALAEARQSLLDVIRTQIREHNLHPGLATLGCAGADCSLRPFRN
jgi:hypothetical protein